MALITPQTGSSSIYDPSLPARIAQGQQAPQQPPDTIASIAAGQAKARNYNPSFGADTSPEADGAGSATRLRSRQRPRRKTLFPALDPAPGCSQTVTARRSLASSVKGNYLKPYLGQCRCQGRAPYRRRRSAAVQRQGPSNERGQAGPMSAGFSTTSLTTRSTALETRRRQRKPRTQRRRKAGTFSPRSARRSAIFSGSTPRVSRRA